MTRINPRHVSLFVMSKGIHILLSVQTTLTLTLACQHNVLSHGPDCLDMCSTNRLHRNDKVHLSPPFNFWLYFARSPSAVGVVGW